MSEGNTQFVLHNDSVEFLTSTLTKFAQVARAMRLHDEANEMETIRNTIQTQYYSG